MAAEPRARGSVFAEAVVSGGASGAATRGVRDGARAGPGIQQAQRNEWRRDRPGTWQGDAAIDAEADEVHRADRRVAGEHERLPAVAAEREWTETATGDG